VGNPKKTQRKENVMTFFKTLDSLASAADATGNYEGIVKVAEESEFTRNDLIVHHNLTHGNIYTQEGIIKVAEDEEESRLVTAVMVYEKLAADEMSEQEAIDTLEANGLEVEDYNDVAALLDKQAEDAGLIEDEGIVADEEVWEKVAEAFDFLAESGLDPVTSMEFAEDFSMAEDEETQDKVASEYDGIDEESIDKIAEAFDYLSDIEGVPPSVLMAELDKEANAFTEGAKKIGEKVWKGGAMKAAQKKRSQAIDKFYANKKGFKTGKKRWLAEDERLNGVAGAKQARKWKNEAKAEIRSIKKHRAKVVGGAAAGTTAAAAGTVAYKKNK
jgi:hypothetical protein